MSDHTAEPSSQLEPPPGVTPENAAAVRGHDRSYGEQKDYLREIAAKHRQSYQKQHPDAFVGESDGPPPESWHAIKPKGSGVESQATVDTDVDDGLSDTLRELSLAGGDLHALASLARSDRTELTAVLKELGFKALGPRRRIETELQGWVPPASGSAAGGAGG